LEVLDHEGDLITELIAYTPKLMKLDGKLNI
jgi:hypothetical protein